MDDCRIAIIGATGAVGNVFLRILEEREFPASSIRLCASRRSLGKRLRVNGQMLDVEEVTPGLLREVDIAFISATGAISRSIAPVAVKSGALVIDDSSVFRMDDDVPLVVPEVNSGDLRNHKGIVSIPNCSTTPLVMALKPLSDVNPVKRVIVDTYQSVSGTGLGAVEELKNQSRQILEGKSTSPKEYPHQIAFNVLPHIEPFQQNGYTNEEMKLVNETRKILHLPELAVSATCARVPVMVGHSESVHIEFVHSITPCEVREILVATSGISLLDDTSLNMYPMPVHAAGKDEVFVGRIRQDISHPNGIAMWLVSDNLRKGAALNALQIAEELLRAGLLSDGRI